MKIKDGLKLLISCYNDQTEIHSEIIRRFKCLHNSFGVGDPLVCCKLKVECTVYQAIWALLATALACNTVHLIMSYLYTYVPQLVTTQL